MLFCFLSGIPKSRQLYHRRNRGRAVGGTPLPHPFYPPPTPLPSPSLLYPPPTPLPASRDTCSRAQVGYLMGRFADGASTVADPYRVFVTPPIALRICRCVSMFIRQQSKLKHFNPESRVGSDAAGGVWRRLTVRFNNEGDVLVVLQASPAGATGGASEVSEEVRRVSSHARCT
jgi:hypothetical protein